MRIDTETELSFSRQLVFETYRDRLAELAPYLPNIRTIERQSRDDSELATAQRVRVTNLWTAHAEIPMVAQAFIKPEMLAWLDHAVWDGALWRCDWTIEPRLFKDQIRCQGVSEYIELGNNRSKLRMYGDLEIKLAGIPGVPKLLAGKIAPTVEKFIVQLITPNLVAVAKGLEAFLRDQSGKAV